MSQPEADGQRHGLVAPQAPGHLYPRVEPGVEIFDRPLALSEQQAWRVLVWFGRVHSKKAWSLCRFHPPAGAREARRIRAETAASAERRGVLG
jgi:hypothetical protein